MIERLERIGFSGFFNAGAIGAVAVVVLFQATYHGFHVRQASVPAQVRDLLWFSVLCGLAAMAAIEIAKRLTPIRGLYQRRQSALWFRARAPARRRATSDDDAPSRTATESDDLYEPLLHALRLRTRADLTRVFNLPTEQLAAQVSSAADAALIEPGEQGWLLGALTAESEEVAAGSPPPGSDPAPQLRMARLVRAGVDHFQIDATERWRRYVQGAAVWISGLFGVGMAYTLDVDARSRATFILAALVIGGALAWFARDAAASLERYRR